MSATAHIATLLGPLADLLDEEDITEISANADGKVFVKRFGRPPDYWGDLARADAERFLRWCASGVDTVIRDINPMFSDRIPGTAHRIAAQIPPVVDAPSFSIRRHRAEVIPLEEFVPGPVPRAQLVEALERKHNILIAGATGAGKTTLLNACLAHLSRTEPDTRPILIEDTPEIRAPFANRLSLRTCDEVDMNGLLVQTLRLDPDRIVVGEVREGRVLMTLIKALNTGHPGGLTTLHANSAADVLDRLKILAGEVMITDPTPQLMACLDMIVFLTRGRDRPELATIATVRPGADGTRKLEITYDAAS